MTKLGYHVYAVDGFETAHSSERAAIAAAKRGAKRRGVGYRVVKCDAYGMTGGGRGTVVFAAGPQEEV